MRDRLLALGARTGEDLAYLEILGGQHNEAAWAERLPLVLRFLFGPDRFAELPRETLDVMPLVDELLLGAVEESSVTVRLAHPEGLAQTLPNAQVDLEVVDGGVATLDEDGTLRALGSGETEIVARFEGLEARAALSVRTAERQVFRVRVPAGTPADDTIHVVGDAPALGQWDGVGLALAPQGGGLWEGEAAFAPSLTLRYKYTRGSWATVEKQSDGSERSDRVLTVGGTATDDVVERWADM